MSNLKKWMVDTRDGHSPEMLPSCSSFPGGSPKQEEAVVLVAGWMSIGTAVKAEAIRSRLL